MTLWRTFRNDRLFAVLFVLLLICAWLPLTRTPFLPFIDLQNNIGGAAMLDEAFSGGPMSKYFEVNRLPVPYWTGYLIMAVAAHVGGALFAAKFICGVLSLVVPLSAVRFLIATGRDHRQGLWAFLLVWDRNLYAGWVSFLLGMAIATYTLALLAEVKDWRSALRVTLMSGVVALSHPQALVFLAVAGITMVLVQPPNIKRLALGTLALSGGLVGAIPLVRELRNGLPPDKMREAVTFDWDTPREKMAGFYDFTFGSFGGAFDTVIPVFVFGAVLFAPLMLAMLRKTMPRAKLAPPLIFLASCIFLYLILPFEIKGPVPHRHNYVRYGTFILLGLMFIPKPRLERRAAWALFPAVVLALLLDWHVARQLRDVATRLQPFEEIIASIKPHSTILPMVNEYGDPACQMAPLNQFHAYATGATRSFDPLLFDNRLTPVLYKPTTRLPYLYNVKLDYERFIRHYDYVLVQGLKRDPFQTRTIIAPVTLVKEAGMWRLYSVAKR